jgi:type VI secretion system protein ImpL
LNIYSNDFVTTWRAALGNLRLKKLLADKPKYDALRALSAPTSPLRQILESIRDETALTKERPKPTNAAAPSDALARPSPALFNMQDGSPGAGIEAQFKPFHSVLEGDSTRRPIDSVVANLNDIAQNLTLIVDAASANTEPTDRSMPPMIKTKVMPTASTIRSGIWLARVLKVSYDRKWLLRTENSATMASKAPARPR